MADARRMGKSELFSSFAERFEVKRTQAREYFDYLTELAEKELKRSGEFVLPGMVKLVVQKRKAREGRNPATGDPIKIPKVSPDHVDWEIELGTVIGRRARYVAAPKAQDHVFGYTVMLDISDRGGRPPGGFSGGTDWFVMKGQDTFGPMGPFIVPKEFFGNPMTDLKQTLLDLSQTATIDHSLRLGSSVLRRLEGVNTLHKPRVEQASFAVLKAPDVPSILVETAFISNPAEERRLNDER